MKRKAIFFKEKDATIGINDAETKQQRKEEIKNKGENGRKDVASASFKKDRPNDSKLS